jgi:hypothetical protein
LQPHASLGRGLVLVGLAACRAGPASPPAGAEWLDAATVAAIATELQVGLVAAGQDSGAIAVDHLGRARARNPDADELTYLLAYAHGLARDTAGAVRWLDSLAARRSCLVPQPGEAFASIEDVPEVARAIAAIRDRAPAQHPSRVAFTLPDRDLFPEGIAYDPADGSIFLSSLRHRSVVRVARDPSGTARAHTFTVAGRDSLYSVLGLKVDGRRRRLWVATAAEGFAANESAAETGNSAVLVYDLTTGRTLRRFPIPRPPARLANDLTLDTAGVAYVTDTQSGALYRAALESDSIEVLLPAGSFAQPNGIVATPDGRALLVADGLHGAWYVDLATRTRRHLPQRLGPMPLFLDGLDLHQESLIAVSHAISLGWVLRFRLSATFDSVLASEVLDCHHPLARQPTTGVVAGDTLFYIATSQFRALGGDRPPAVEELRDIVVLSLRLR